jgi:hypothetical protein
MLLIKEKLGVSWTGVFTRGRQTTGERTWPVAANNNFPFPLKARPLTNPGIGTAATSTNERLPPSTPNACKRVETEVGVQNLGFKNKTSSTHLPESDKPIR